jgi:HSP20 family protein
MTLIKQRGTYPSMRSLLEDFWNNDTLLEDRFWNTRVNLPAVNIIEKDDKFLIEMAAPGLRKEDFKINIENGILQIDSESQREVEEEKDNYTRKEFNYSSFSRSFTLPENASEENIAANYENGVLKLKLQKLKSETSHKKKQILIA